MIWALLTTNPIARALAKIGAVVLAVLTFGAWQRHKGAQAAREKRAAQDAQSERKAHERINEADTGAGLDDSQRVERLRDFARRNGNSNGSSKAGRG